MVRQSTRAVILGGFVLCGILALSGHPFVSHIPGITSMNFSGRPLQGDPFSWETVKRLCLVLEPGS